MRIRQLKEPVPKTVLSISSIVNKRHLHVCPSSDTKSGPSFARRGNKAAEDNSPVTFKFECLLQEITIQVVGGTRYIPYYENMISQLFIKCLLSKREGEVKVKCVFS